MLKGDLGEASYLHTKRRKGIMSFRSLVAPQQASEGESSSQPKQKLHISRWFWIDRFYMRGYQSSRCGGSLAFLAVRTEKWYNKYICFTPRFPLCSVKRNLSVKELIKSFNHQLAENNLPKPILLPFLKLLTSSVKLNWMLNNLGHCVPHKIVVSMQTLASRNKA